MAKKNRRYVYLFILVLVALYIIIYVVPKVTGAFETTEILTAGSLQETEKTTCYFVRDEQVYEAGAAGKLKYHIEEGTHIRSGTKVASLTGTSSGASAGESEKKKSEQASKYEDMIRRLGNRAARTLDCKSESSGIVSYYVDGYEAFFTPDRLEKLEYEDVKELEVQAEDTKRKSTLKNEPIFKISDNDNWYLVCWVEAASVARYEIGNSVTLQLAAGDVKATVENITQAGEQWKIVFRSNRYYKDFSKARTEEVQIVTGDYSGLIAKNSSITTKDGKPGVMVRQTDGEYVFTRVKILARSGEYSVMQDESFTDEEGNTVPTVKVYDEILKKPGKGT